MVLLLSVGCLWVALGWVGWYNGHRHLVSLLGRKGDCTDVAFTIAFGPFNLVTFALWGWNLHK